MSDISFPSSPSGGDTYTYNNITFTYDGEKWTAKAPVTTTGTYGDANVAAYASSQGFIDLTDISVTSNSPSGNGSLSYNNGSGVFTFTPADASGSGGGSYGNTEVQSYLDAQGYSNVDLDAQTLSLAGNVITISGSNSNVDLTTALGNVSGGGSAQTLTLNSTAGQLAISGGNNVDLRQTQFLYSSSSDLPSASTYHGAIAHVHDEGALFFAHSGSWNKLANDDDVVKSGNETTFTNDIKFDTGVEEKFSTLTGQSGTVTHDCNNGHVFYHTTPAGDITANFTNLGLTAEYTTNITIVINQGATAREVTAIQIGGSSTTINWQGGSAPTGTANGIDAFSFTILNDGGSYVVLGQMVDFT